MKRKLLLKVLLLISCQSAIENNELIIESPIVEIRFDHFRLNEYTEKKYFQIDDIIITHSENYLSKNSQNDTIYLPSFNYVVAQTGEKEYLEKTNTFELSHLLAKKLSKKKELYMVVNPKELDARGNLIIKRTDKKKIKLIIPNDYSLILGQKK